MIPNELGSAQLDKKDQFRFEHGSRVTTLPNTNGNTEEWQVSGMKIRPFQAAPIDVSSCKRCQSPSCSPSNLTLVPVPAYYNEGTKISRKLMTVLSKAPETEVLWPCQISQAEEQRIPFGKNMKVVFIPKMSCYTANLTVTIRGAHQTVYVLHAHYLGRKNQDAPLKKAQGHTS